MVRPLRSGKCYGSYDVLWKCSVFFDIFWYILMILTRHLAHLGSSWLSICLYTATNTEQLTSWQPDHPIIVCLRLILISWLISLVQLSSALIVLQFATNCCFWLLMLLLLWGRKPLQRKRPFTSCCENGSSYGFQTKNLKFTDSRLDSSRLISTSKFVEQLVCSILLYLMMYLFCFFLRLQSARDCLYYLVLIVYWIVLFFNQRIFQMKRHSGFSIRTVCPGRRQLLDFTSLNRSWAVCILSYRTISRHFSWEGYDFFYFFRGRFWIFLGVPGSMPPYFSAFLLLCFSASLLLCFLLFLLLCLSTSFLFCFPAFPASLLLCLSTSTILLFLFFSHVFLLSYFLLLCFSASCFYCLFVFVIFLCFILSCLYPKWNPKDPRSNPKDPQRNPDKKPQRMKP